MDLTIHRIKAPKDLGHHPTQSHSSSSGIPFPRSSIAAWRRDIPDWSILFRVDIHVYKTLSFLTISRAFVHGSLLGFGPHSDKSSLSDTLSESLHNIVKDPIDRAKQCCLTRFIRGKATRMDRCYCSSTIFCQSQKVCTILVVYWSLTAPSAIATADTLSVQCLLLVYPTEELVVPGLGK